MLQLPAFKMQVVENVVTASARSDHWRVSRWIKMVDLPGIKMKQLAEPGKHYQTLDRKLATGLSPLITGEWGRKVTNMKRKIMSKKGKHNLLAGRQILHMLYQFFRTSRNMGVIYSIVDLTKLEWLGDDKIEVFRNNWDNRVAGLPHRTSRNTMSEILLDCLTKSTVLKSKVDKYKRKYKGRKKNYC